MHGKALGNTSKALGDIWKALGTTEDQEALGDIQQALGTTKRLWGIIVRLEGKLVGKQIFNFFLWNKKR